MDQEITFSFVGAGSQLVSETRKVKRELDDLDKATTDQNKARSRSTQEATQATRQNAQETRKAGLDVTALAAKYYLVVQALQAVLGAGKAVYGTLIAQNVQLQEQLLGTQASLAATNRVIVDGVEVTDPTEAIQALEGPVNDALARVRAQSLDLVGVTSQQLIPIFQNIAGQSGRINASLEDSADLTIKFAASLGTLKIPLEQQRQEISSILNAQITSDSVLAKSLGLNNEMVRTWQRQGTLVEELNGRLETFAAGNALAAQTIGGVASNIQEIFETITLQAGAGLTDTLASDLNQIYQLLQDNQDAILGFVQDGVDFIESIFTIAKDGGSDLLRTLAPIGEAVAEVFDEDLLNLVENIFEVAVNGFNALAEQLVDSEAIQDLLKLLDAGILTANAFFALNGEFRAGIEATEIYRQNSSRVAQQAVDTLGKIKRGEEGAAAARKEALASIDDQIKILEDANVTGVENRRVVRSQISELELWRQKLSETGSGVELVSKSTEQLTNDLKLLQTEFKDASAELDTAQTQLRAAVQRQLASGAIDARAANAQTLQIEREGLDERIALVEDKLTQIAALEAQGGDDEQKKEFQRQRLDAEKQLATLQIQQADNVIKERQRLEAEALQEFQRTQDQANNAIAASVTARETEIQRQLNAGTINARTAQQLRLEAAADRIREELALEEQKTRELEALTFGDVEKQEENQRKIRASRQRTADLQLRILEQEQKLQDEAIKRTIKAIADQADEERNQSEARIGQLQDQLRLQGFLNEQYDRSNRLLSAQRDLAAAQRLAVATGGQIELDNLTRALELRKRLNDDTLDPEVREVLERQLEALTGEPDISEAEILAQRVLRENELQQLKRQTLAIEQDAARAALDVELQRNRLAAERLVIETEIAALSATQAEADAESRLDQLLADPNADPQAINNAIAALERAQQNTDLASRAQANAAENVAQQDRLAQLAQAKLTAEQQVAIAQFEAADAARQQANELEIVEAKAQSILEKLQASSEVDFSSTFNRLVERNRQLLGASQPITGATPITPTSNAAPRTSADFTGPGQLEQLVNLAQKQVAVNETLSTQIQRVANRPGTVQNVQNNLIPRDRILASSGL